jgi:serine/threonine-protein kinase
MAKVFTITEGLENMGALKTGGQGSVYKGRRIGQIITAVKLLPTPIHSEDPHDKNYRDFQNEVSKLKKVNEEPNPNVVKMLHFGITETGSFPFIEMEFIEGPDLEELLQPPHDPVFTIKEAIKLADQLSNALAHCHSRDVKHGDIKSNNVKFNKNTGNYVLLDFGLAALSDEQRRTSLRHAGAVEFMAPEQNEGHLLFQSDVYSFGVILFELLAGIVPFPLGDKGESARNLIMLAHKETPPPDIIELRKQHIPEEWSEIKRTRESQIPQWLLTTVYRCLQKNPKDRFLNGMDLHEYIVLNSTLPVNNETIIGSDKLSVLKQQNRQLVKEKEKLEKAILRYEQEAKKKDLELNQLKSKIYGLNNNYPPKKKSSSAFLIAGFITLLIFSLMIYTVVKDSRQKKPQQTTETKPVQKPSVVAQYRVVADRAYFYTNPGDPTHRAAFLEKTDLVKSYNETADFIYTEYTNSMGQTSKGWLQRSDLMPASEWTRREQQRRQSPEELYKDQLKKANDLVVNFQIPEALAIYKPMVDKEVPEAMYQYGNLALQDQNPDIDCTTAYNLVSRAADKGYLPAKTTLGYLYLFADNTEVLQSGKYTRCSFTQDSQKGVELLKESAAAGDETAKKMLQQFNQTMPPVNQ